VVTGEGEWLVPLINPLRGHVGKTSVWLLSFLLRVSILTRDIDIANLSVWPSVCLSVCLSVHNVPVSDEKGLTYRHSFFTVR